MSQCQQISPVFVVRDVAAAIDHYVNQLGFVVSWKWGSPPTHAGIARDAIEIHLTSDPRDDRAPGGSNAYVFVTDVDEHFRDLRERGATFINEPADRPYGMRDFDVRDPDGNALAFGMEART